MSVVALGIFLSLLGGCGTGPTEPEPTYGTFNVYNGCGATVDVFLDGVFRSTLLDSSSDQYLAITVGSHVLDAYLTGTQTLVKSFTIDVVAGLQYAVNIPGPATITVTNLFGEILKIYVDNLYIGDIGPNITQTVYKIRLGVRALKALKRSDGTEAATTSIDVVAIADYPWIILP